MTEITSWIYKKTPKHEYAQGVCSCIANTVNSLLWFIACLINFKRPISGDISLEFNPHAECIWDFQRLKGVKTINTHKKYKEN